MTTHTALLSQAAIGVILLSIQTTLAPTAFAQSANGSAIRSQQIETMRVEDHSPGRQQPTSRGTFAAPSDVSTIECQQLGSGAFLCGCGTTPQGECNSTFRSNACHIEPGQGLCTRDISDE